MVCIPVWQFFKDFFDDFFWRNFLRILTNFFDELHCLKKFFDQFFYEFFTNFLRFFYEFFYEIWPNSHYMLQSTLLLEIYQKMCKCEPVSRFLIDSIVFTCCSQLWCKKSHQIYCKVWACYMLQSTLVLEMSPNLLQNVSLY